VSERWQQVERLYHAALERGAEGCAAFLAEACAGDEGLRREVESLLAYEDRAEDFIESPALEFAAQMMADENAAVVVGQRISHYRVTSPLGAGGMGEVYLAEDTRLGRRVALKFLPALFTQNKEHLHRFEQEARAASALSHPNVCVIHEIDDTQDGRRFITMEYIEGTTLRQQLAQKRLTLMEALDVAAQIAAGLGVAHATGIVHRDIKPENVMLRNDGLVKVLDFGLAKLTRQTTETDAEALMRSLVQTGSGIIMGTGAYMSPEQARGLAVDSRTDIWSLGVLLYEMVAGRAPFAGATPSDMLVSILERDPPTISRDALELPAELERIVRKALQKDREARYQTAEEFLGDLKSLRHELEITGSQSANQTIVADKRITINSKQEKSGSKRIVAIVTASILLASIATWFVWDSRNVSRARRQVPQIEALSSNGNYFAAYDLAAETQKYLPNDPTITRLMRTISDTLTVTSEPAGAQVYLKRFSPDVAGNFPPRQLVGTTPIRDLRIARGQYLLYVEKDGFATTVQTISGAILLAGFATVVPPPLTIEEKLLAADRVPNGMTLVPGGDYRLRAWARPIDARVQLDDFLIDQYEVSNEDYKEFINAGGYLKKQYWTHPFIKDGKTLTWEEGIQEFKDRTGLPGPRTWSSQNFPEDKAKYPVTDVSWYEAAAYAAFRGKQLPTIFQWEKAARDGRTVSPTIYMPWGAFNPGDKLRPRANFEGDATIPVDSCEFGVSPFGAYNMAGNVSEWCLNETSEGFISAGGAWGEPVYTFAYYGRFPGFYTSNKRGFRCAINLGNTGNDGNLRIEINKEIPVYTRSSDQDFAGWVKAYDYHKSPLEPQLEKQETDAWILERIAFNGADGERAIAYLYLPKNFRRPLQVIHFVPPSDVEMGLKPATSSAESFLDTEIKSGRAVFVVVLKGYIERLRPAGFVEPDPTTAEYRDKMVNWITDLRRGLDYLETRNDIDSKKIAFFGPSSGASVGLIVAAVDRRYASVFLAASGIRKSNIRWIAEANKVNFAPHIQGPTLLLQGRYDEILAWKTEAEPLYKLLREPKRLILHDGGHAPTVELFATTTHRWLDETLGPVK
jgi:serine/threonine protein kinase/formylglycine-generating enzyme required for sulfatase activity